MYEILRQEPGGSFSDLWYRVGPMRPQISAHCRVIRQRFGPRTTFIVEDPSGGQFYRLTESAHFFLGLLDGRRSVQDAWESCVSQLGDESPTQRECVELLSRLQAFGLLSGQGPIAPELVEQRRRRARSTRLKARTGYGMSLTLPLLNPDPWLTRAEHILRLVFSRAGFAAWLLLLASGAYHIVAGRHKLSDQLNHVLDPANLFWVSVIFLGLRALHELGHAAACKAMGARTTEIGIILMMLILPFPYCDASNAWRLPEIWKRVVVSAGGVMFELPVAALAAIIWARSDDPTVVSLCFNVMFISGFTTLLFNLNPLLRYDGYYILSDLTGITNLWQRSRDLWKFLMERGLFGVRGVRPPPIADRREFWILLLYGIFSMPYRVFVTFTIVFFVWSNPHYMTLGAVLAAISVVMFLIWPLVQAAWYLATAPVLMAHRTRAIGSVAAILGAALLVLAVIPMPAAEYAPGIVHAAREQSLRTPEEGFINRVHAEVGDQVAAGDVIFTIRNVELETARDSAAAARDQALAESDSASADSPASRDVARKRLSHAQAELDRLESRIASLRMVAQVSGVLVPDGGTAIDLQNSVGRFAPRGALLARIVETERPIVRAVISDRDQAYLFRRGTLGDPSALGVSASVRFSGRESDEFPATLVRVAAASTRRVSDPALAADVRGDVLLDPSDPDSKTSLLPQFIVEVRPTDATPAPLGLRARVRLGVANEPLVSQWLRRIAQLFGEQSQI